MNEMVSGVWGAPVVCAEVCSPLSVRASPIFSDFAAHWPRSGRMSGASCHVFQCADFLEPWLDTIGRAHRTKPWFVGVFDAEASPVMLLALGIERRLGIRVLTFLDGTVSDYNQPILFPPARAIDAAGWTTLWEEIVATFPAFDVAILDKMPATIGECANPLMALGAEPIAQSGHVMRLGGSVDELRNRLPERTNRRRSLKRLEAAGPVTLQVAQTPAEKEQVLADMIHNKVRRFAETRVPGFAEVPGKLAFYEQATRALSAPDPLHLSALRAGDNIVASHWGLILADRFYYLMPSHASGAWERCAPALLHLEALIQWCHARGISHFDFGVGDEPYKRKYCDVTMPLYRAIFSATFLGRVHLHWAGLVARLRATKLWQEVRPLKWVVLRALRGLPEKS